MNAVKPSEVTLSVTIVVPGCYLHGTKKRKIKLNFYHK